MLFRSLQFQISTFDKVLIPTITHFPGIQGSPPSFYLIPLHHTHQRQDEQDGFEEVCHECNSGRSLNVLVGPGVENRVQLAAIDCRSVDCVLEGRKREVTREGPTNPKVSTKSRVPENSGVSEWER